MEVTSWGVGGGGGIMEVTSWGGEGGIVEVTSWGVGVGGIMEVTSWVLWYIPFLMPFHTQYWR